MLGERLASARKRVGMSQRQLAAAMGERYDQTMISHVETGRSGLVGDGLSRAAEVLGVSIDYLFGLTNDPRPADLLALTADTLRSDPSDWVRIPKVAALVGGIMYKYDDTVVDHQPFSREWMEQHDLAPANCHLAEVAGKFMEPTLPDGSTILIDLSRRDFRSDCVYIMEMQLDYRAEPDTALVARRVTWNEKAGDWRYYNDAGGFAPSPFLAPPTVIGEVRWVARTL